jgi:hypothetical protein
MKLIASAIVKTRKKVSATTVTRLLSTAKIRSNQPIVGLCDEYDLIDGGIASTIYTPINGFDLISGGNA